MSLSEILLSIFENKNILMTTWTQLCCWRILHSHISKPWSFAELNAYIEPEWLRHRPFHGLDPITTRSSGRSYSLPAFQESKFLRVVQIRVRKRKTADPQRPTQYFQIRSYKLIHTIETRFIRTRPAKVSIRAKTVAKLLHSSLVKGGRDITPATEKVEAIFANSQKIW